MKDSLDVIALSPPYNLAIRRGESLELTASSKSDGRRRVLIRRDRLGRVRVEHFEALGARFVIELDPKGETARLVSPGPIAPSDTEVAVSRTLDSVAEISRGALLDDGETLYPLEVAEGSD